jgi:chromosome segregation ATPase
VLASLLDPTWLLGAASPILALALAWGLWRSGGAKVWRETAEAYKARNDELQTELSRLAERIVAQETKIAELQARCDALGALPDLTGVLDLTRSMLEKHDGLVVELVGKLTSEVARLTEAIERVELRWG